MTRTFLLTVLCLLAVAGATRLSTDADADPSVRGLDLVVVRPDGARVSLQFAVNAPSDAAALQAAIGASRQLVRGGVVLDESEVSAQFAPWWWQWDRAEAPVPVLYNPSGALPGFSEDDVKEALSPWGAIFSSSFSFRYMGTTTATASLNDGVNDGLNVVAWQDLDCSTGCVLGVTTKLEAHEADIVLNSNSQAKLGDGEDGAVDARSVLVHEAGHLAGLEHSCPLFSCNNEQQDAVMYFQYRGIKRGLRADDMAGISALYPIRPGAAQPALLQLELAPGWLLTVLPPGSVEMAMDRLGCVDAVYGFDGTGWVTWLRGRHSSLQSLSWVTAGTAYWIHATASCSHLFEL